MRLGWIGFVDPSRKRCQAMTIASFDADLIDSHWTLIEPLLPAPHRSGSSRTPLQQAVDAILYPIKRGCPWRLLPKNFPPWKTVYQFFWQWSRGPIFSGFNDRLRALIRESEGRRCRPTGAAMDSQTVRFEAHGGAVGYDPGKRPKGRKRFLLADTLGMILDAAVVPANERPKLEIEVIKRSGDPRGFPVLPKRWTIDRTYVWLVQNRRLAQHYKQTESSATRLI